MFSPVPRGRRVEDLTPYTSTCAGETTILEFWVNLDTAPDGRQAAGVNMLQVPCQLGTGH